MWVIELSTGSMIFISNAEYLSINWNEAKVDEESLFVQVVDERKRVHLINPGFIAQVYQIEKEKN